MDDTDEDFGDLYADVEVQAISSISYLPNLCIEQDDINTNASDLIVEKLGSVGDDESKRNSNAEAEADFENGLIADNGSESEDDLNIVLNEDDNGGTFSNLRSGGFDDDEVDEECGDLGSVGEGNGSRKNRKWVDQAQLGDGLEQSLNGGNGAKGSYQSQYSQYKYIRPHAAASPHNSKANGPVGVASLSSAFSRGDWEDIGSNQLTGSSSIFAQSGYNFSLPRNKSILDVNIDTFEKKPWRHPGIDITAFFNFGFDEESWKDYCNCLDQYRLQTSMSAARIPVYKPAKLSEPKGRAIQVEDSTSERRPSFDVNRQLDRVSDVVIQIPLQDSLEESSGSDKDEVGHIDSPVREASENGDFGTADASYIHCSGSVSGDELLEGNAESCVPKRCSQQTNPSDPLSPDYDSHGSGQIADVNGHDQKNTVCNSEGKSEVMETSNSTREEIDNDKNNIAPSYMEIESSLGEQSQHSRLSLSCSGSQSEAPHDAAYIDTEKVHNCIRRSSPNSAGELRESVTSDYYNAKDSKSRDVKTKPRDFESYSRNRNRTLDDRRQYSRRLHSESKFKRHSKDDGASPRYGTEAYYEFHHSRIDHNFNSQNREHLSYYRDSELSYGRESFYGNEVQMAYSKNYHRKGSQRFGDETERFLSRKDEGDYFLEERVPRVNGEVIERDWYRYERGPVVDDLDTLTCRDSRRLVSERSSYLGKKERGTRWRGKGDELHFRQRTRNDDFFVEYNYTDDFVREKYGRSVPPDDMEIDYGNNTYERHLPYTRRNFENYSRTERTCDIPCSDLDNLWSRGDEDEYQRCTGHRSLSSRSYKELRAADGGRWPDTTPPRNDMYALRKPKRHESHKTEIWTESYRDGNWLGSYNDTFDMEENIGYPNSEGHFEQRRHNSHSENKNFSRNRGDEFLAGEESFSLRRTSRHNGFHAKHGPNNVPKLINDGRAPQHRYKRVREGNSESRIDRGSSITHRDNHEQTLLRCGNSVDLRLVVGEGKSSGRSSAAGSLLSNGRIGNMDSNIDKRVISNDCDERHSEKGNADYPEVEKNQNNEKWHDKYPLARQNDALDIEEGQIITEDFSENLMDKDEISDMKERIVANENGKDGNKVVKENNNPRILEMIAKMEKRRERFKEPITLKMELDANPNALVEQVVGTGEAKQERPARKRRWGGN